MLIQVQFSSLAAESMICIPPSGADGSKIAFSSNVNGYSEIFVVNFDGSGLNQLTHDVVNDEEPHISADGSKIAFQSGETGNVEIFVVNSDGSGLKQLTHNSAHDWEPHISADGSKIAFESDATGNLELFAVNSKSQPDNPLIPRLILSGVSF